MFYSQVMSLNWFKDSMSIVIPSYYQIILSLDKKQKKNLGKNSGDDNSFQKLPWIPYLTV